MSIDSTHSKYLIVHSLSLIEGNNTENVLEFLFSKDEAIAGIVGLPISTLDTLEKIGGKYRQRSTFLRKQSDKVKPKS